MAVRDNLKFGKDIVFTYGPLGYLSTRYTEYISDWNVLLFDMFILSCFYYIFYRILEQKKAMAYIIVIAIFFFRGTGSSQVLFSLFILFAIFGLKNNFKNYYEVAICAICGVIVFFVKINYGIIVLFIFPFLITFLAIKKQKALVVFLLTSIVGFCIIYATVNIDLLNYITNSIPMIVYYNESMQLSLPPFQPSYLAALMICAVFAGMMSLHTWNLYKARNLTFVTVYPTLLLSLLVFLEYKNGFTRNDNHNDDFFAAMPLFMVFVTAASDLCKSKVAYVGCLITLVIAAANLSDTQFNLPHRAEMKGFVENAYVNQPLHYFDHVFEKQPDPLEPRYTIPKDKLSIIGHSKIDVMPIDVWLAQLNNLNYSPRPVLQSYSAYCGAFDSLNALHFYGADRPDYILSWTWSIDNRYPAWDESLTKAMIRLNYDYAGFLSLKNDRSLSNDYGNYLLLKSKKGISKYPKFEKLYDKTINFGDTVHIDFPGDIPVYMSADIQYSTIGTLNKIFFQPAVIDVTLFFDSSCTQGIIHRAIRPLLEKPVIINKYIGQNMDFLNFMTGALVYDKDIKAFAFHSKAKDIKRSMKLTFYKFTNY